MTSHVPLLIVGLCACIVLGIAQGLFVSYASRPLGARSLSILGAITGLWYLLIIGVAVCGSHLIVELGKRKNLWGRFRVVFVPSEPDWVILWAAVLVSSIGAVSLILFGSPSPLTPFIAEEPSIVGSLILFLTIPVSFGLATLVVNLLRGVQYIGTRMLDIPISSHLSADGEDLSSDFVKQQVQSVETNLTILVSRDEQARQEIHWTRDFIAKIREPRIFDPPDVFSIDSQISLRSIYPAAMLLWSEQVRLRIQNVQPKPVVAGSAWSDSATKWRQNLVGYLESRRSSAVTQFLNANSNIGAPDELKYRGDDETISDSSSLAIRILVFDIKVLLTEVVGAVLESHAAAKIPLFFVPAFYVREAVLAPEVSQRVLAICQDFAELQLKMYEVGEGIWPPWNSSGENSLGEPLWRQSEDDCIVVDDTAWTGYPNEPREDPRRENALPHLRQFLAVLGLPRLLLASHARALAMKARDGGTQEQLFRDWYKQSGG